MFNATFDPVEGRWKALQSSGMFGAIHYGTAVYRNELAAQLHGLGYRTRQTAHGFEIEGVDQKLIERFSKRSQQRNAAVAREEKRLGRKLSNDEISHVVHQSRPRKVKDATEDEVRARQLDEIGFFEKRALRRVVDQADGERVEPAERVSQSQALGHAQEHVFARQSVFPAGTVAGRCGAAGTGGAQPRRWPGRRQGGPLRWQRPSWRSRFAGITVSARPGKRRRISAGPPAASR